MIEHEFIGVEQRPREAGVKLLSRFGIVFRRYHGGDPVPFGGRRLPGQDPHIERGHDYFVTFCFVHDL